MTSKRVLKSLNIHRVLLLNDFLSRPARGFYSTTKSITSGLMIPVQGIAAPVWVHRGVFPDSSMNDAL